MYATTLPIKEGLTVCKLQYPGEVMAIEPRTCIIQPQFSAQHSGRQELHARRKQVVMEKKVVLSTRLEDLK